MIKRDDLAKPSRKSIGGGMKQASDIFTREPKRGRPAKPNALTPAQRAQRYRDKLKANPRLAASIAHDRVLFSQRRIQSLEQIADAWGAVERHFSADTPFPGNGP